MHDRYEDNGKDWQAGRHCAVADTNAAGGRRSAPRRRHSPDAADSGAGTRIRVDNIHYDLTQEDIEVCFIAARLKAGINAFQGLFVKIGPVAKLALQYDRAGRSEGTAYVTYESSRDAQEAVREYDGANANGRAALLFNGGVEQATNE